MNVPRDLITTALGLASTATDEEILGRIAACREELERYVAAEIDALARLRILSGGDVIALRAYAFGGEHTLKTSTGRFITIECPKPGRAAFDRAVQILASATPSRAEGAPC